MLRKPAVVIVELGDRALPETVDVPSVILGAAEPLAPPEEYALYLWVIIILPPLFLKPPPPE